MIATLAKHFTFDAAHCLPNLGPNHKCHRLHGHTYEVELVCRGQVDERGFVIDYDDIAQAWGPIYRTLDHQYLNEIAGLETPSTEHLVAWMFRWLHESVSPGAVHESAERTVWGVLDRIRIKESSSTWCEMTKVEWMAFCGPMA
jgi:6-pyruvoyltetrahydropterin/6-carboxytetrahydropterin synthase